MTTTVTAHLDVTWYAIPHGQGLQLLVGQLRDIAADVHAAATVWRNIVCFVARPIQFSNSSRLAFSAKRDKVPFSAGHAIRIFYDNRVGRGRDGRSGPIADGILIDWLLSRNQDFIDHRSGGSSPIVRE